MTVVEFVGKRGDCYSIITFYFGYSNKRVMLMRIRENGASSWEVGEPDDRDGHSEVDNRERLDGY
jgi:hypothetical protein